MDSNKKNLSPDPPNKYPPLFIPDKYKAKAEGNCKIPGLNIIDPISFNECLFKFTYVWLDDGLKFWSKPVHINEDYVLLWIWRNKFWIYGYIPTYLINSYMSY